MGKYLSPPVRDDLYYQDATLYVKNLTSSGTVGGATVTATGTLSGATLTGTGLTSGRVPFATTGGALTDDGDLTFDTDTLTATKVQVGTQGRFGDATTNYTNFDNTGHQTMAGSARPWEDLRIEPVARTTGGNAPAFQVWRTNGAGSRGCYLYSFDDAVAGSEKEIHFSMQMPHQWDFGPIKLHVHWQCDLDDTSATPRWGLEYTWAEPGADIPVTTTVYATGNTEGATDLTKLHHYITELVTLTPSSTTDGLSTILIGRLFRDSANAADTYNVANNRVGLLYIDAHYQVSSIGSTDEYTK